MLEEYRRKRDFEQTGEPSGQNAVPEGARFVVQKHAASHLHYDFRLEEDGVLKSWAVPKGPSLDPADRRLAMQVEDHPSDYGGFEGTIPAGQYGGGTVMLWDRGSWETVSGSIASGRLKLVLRGEKLVGGWNLVRMHADEKSWLLIKERDEHARPRRELDVGSLDRSVVSQRSMEEIASHPEAVWQSNHDFDLGDLEGSVKADLPDFLAPQLAQAAERAPSGSEWAHEIKYDGYRLLARIEHGRVTLLTRSGQDWTDRFPSIAQALAPLPLNSGFLDGELIATDPGGKTSFQTLQNGAGALTFFVFDLPFADGRDLRKVSLGERKAALERLLAELAAESPVRYCEHIVGGGAAVLEHACKMGLEGVVSKRLDSLYAGRRTASWLKMKCHAEEDLVVVGYTDPSGARDGFGALLLAQQVEGELVYCGKVGTGFSDATLRDLGKRLQKLAVSKCPLLKKPAVKGAHWVRPELVAQVKFAHRTDDGILRHSVFLGIREDKPLPVKISNPDRVVDPSSGATKLDVARYYATVGEAMLRHVGGRPLTIVRCPAGIQGESFYQKHVKDGFPSSVRSIPIDGEPYIAIDSCEALVALAQFGMVEAHPWGSREDNLERPDRLIFDFDPDEALDWSATVAGALEMRERLEILGLRSFCKTTGGKGLHVVVPLEPKVEWETAKSFCKALAELMEGDSPSKYVSVMSKARRKGRIFIDYLRNGRGATSVAPYSLRARAGMPISAPLSWDELPGVDRESLCLSAWGERHLREDALWPDFFGCRQRITKVMLKALKVAQ